MQPKTYFDVIPPESLSVLIPWLATYPYTEDWLTSITPSDALVALRCKGALGRAAQDQMRTMGKRDFWHSKSMLLVEVLKCIAPTLRHLYLRRCLCGTYKFQDLPSLRKLEVSKHVKAEFIDQILTRNGAGIREVRLFNIFLAQSTIECIRTYCRSLEIFDLNHSKYGGGLGPIVGSIGASLRHLKFHRCSQKELTCIGTHCSKLEILNTDFMGALINTNGTLVNEILQKLPSLQTLHVIGEDHYSLEELRAALHECPPKLGINFTMKYYDINRAFEFCRVLGLRMTALTLTGLIDTFPNDVVSTLGNLQKLTIHGNRQSISIGSFFSKPLLNLRVLHVSFWPDVEIDLDAISRNVTTLTDVKFWFVHELHKESNRMPVTTSELLRFVYANKSLRRYMVDYGNNGYFVLMEHRVVNQIYDFLFRLRPNDALRLIDIFYSGESATINYLGNYEPPHLFFKRACVSLRTKRVNITVNGSVIQPTMRRYEG